MTFITNPSISEKSCRETQKNTYHKDCNGDQRPPSRKKSNCYKTDRRPSFQGCIELGVDKCQLAYKTKSSTNSKTNLCVSLQSPRLKKSPNGSSSGLCGSKLPSKPKESYEMPSSCCASHAPKLKKSSGSNSKLCATRKSSKQSMRGKSCTTTGSKWCDCRNLPTQKIDCDRKVCIIPDEGQYVRNEWWCDCRGINKNAGKKLCVRPGPIVPKGNIHLPDSAMEDATTYKTDYPGKYLPPRAPIKQLGSMQTKSGPMSSLTTTKVDYQPKPLSRRDPIYPIGSTFGSTNPMEGETTTRHDYQVPRGFIPSKSFRPIQACKPFLDPMQDETTQKADYVDWHTRGPQGPFPWTPGNKFSHPIIPMVGDTTYKIDYTNNGMGDRRMPIKPRSQGLGIFGNKFDSCTTYKNDYVPWECVNEYDYSPPQEMIKCYKLEGETPEDPDKKLWCYKAEDVCPYYPPKPIDGAIAGTSQYVVRPSEGEKSCVAPKPPFNSHICDSEALLRISCPPAADKCNSNNILGCQNDNSYSQQANHYSSTVQETKDYNTSSDQPCGSSRNNTKNYMQETNQTCYTKDYNYSVNQSCGPNNYSYLVNLPCRPSRQETKDYRYDDNQNFVSTVQVSQPNYAPFQECSYARQEEKPTLVTNHYDPCSYSDTKSKPKEACENSPSKPYYSIGQKYDQNCACVTQPTSRFTTHEQRVLTVHC